MAFSSNGNSFDENSYLQTLEKQKAMIEESQQRKGEQPTNFLSRQQCIDGYEMGLLMDKMKAAAVGVSFDCFSIQHFHSLGITHASSVSARSDD